MISFCENKPEFVKRKLVAERMTLIKYTPPITIVKVVEAIFSARLY